jgi:hypothetical protein
MSINTIFGARRACLAALSAALFLVGCDDPDRLPSSGDDDHQHEPGAAAGRLVFAEVEGEHSHAYVYDLHDAGFVGEFELGHVVTALHPSPGKRYAVVIQRNDNRVNFIDGGQWVEDHGDHDHAQEALPQLMSLVLDGVRPTHYEAHEGAGTLFFDGLQADDIVAGIGLFSDASIGNGLQLATHAFDTFQHGTAEPRGGWLLATHREAGAEGTLPNQVDLLELHGDHFHQERRFEEVCEGLHGSASNHDYSLFGCTDGVLVVHQAGDSADDFSAAKLAIPERIGTLVAHHDRALVAGFAGSNLYAIDPAAETAVLVDWQNGTDLTQVAHALDARGERLLLLDSEGALHLLDAEDGFATLAVIPQVVDASGQGFVIAASHAAEQVFVSDPAQQRIAIIDLQQAEVDGHIELDFAPVGLTWLGVAETQSDAHDH